jgi:hypothetical protein
LNCDLVIEEAVIAALPDTDTENKETEDEPIEETEERQETTENTPTKGCGSGIQAAPVLILLFAGYCVMTLGIGYKEEKERGRRI